MAYNLDGRQLAARPASPRRARSYDDGDPFDADAARAQFSRHNYHRRVQDQGDDSPQYDGGPSPLSAAGAARRDYRSFPWSDDNPRTRIYPPPLAVDGDATGGLGYQFLRRRGGGGHRRHLPDDAYRPPLPRWADQGDDQDDADWRGSPRARLADGRDHAVRWDRRQGADPTEERDRPGGARSGRRPEDTPRAESTLEGRQDPRQEPRQSARREDARQDPRQDRKEPRQDSRQEPRQDAQLDVAQAVASEGQPDGRTVQDDVQDATPNPKPLIVRVWLSIDQRSGPVLLQQVSLPPPPFQPGAAHLVGGHRRPRPAPKAPPPPPGDLRSADKTAASKHIVINNYYNHFPLDGATQDGSETTPYEQTTPDTSATEQGVGNEEPQPFTSESSADLTVSSLADATVTTAMPSQTDSVEPLPASDLETYLGSDLRDADDAKPSAHAGHLAKPVLTERIAERSADRTVLKAASAGRQHAHAGDRAKRRRPSPGPSARDSDGGGASSKSSGGASGAGSGPGSGPGSEAGSGTGTGAARTKAHASGAPSKRCFSIVTENKVKRYKETPC